MADILTLSGCRDAGRTHAHFPGYPAWENHILWKWIYHPGRNGWHPSPAQINGAVDAYLKAFDAESAAMREP